MLIDLNDDALRMQQEVICALGQEEMLLQCAEECNELAIACSKVRRAMFGTTPLSREEAADMLLEEAGDVLLLLDCLERSALLDQEAAKESAVRKNTRWYARTVGK